MAAKIRFYLDENIPIAVSTQLKRRGIEAVTVRDLGHLGDSDPDHLDSYKRGTFGNQTQVRREFIDPFFEALGWDVATHDGPQHRRCR